MNYWTTTKRYLGRIIRYQSAEKIWVFNIRTKDGKLEPRVRNTLRAAQQEIAHNLGKKSIYDTPGFSALTEADSHVGLGKQRLDPAPK